MKTKSFIKDRGKFKSKENKDFLSYDRPILLRDKSAGRTVDDLDEVR